MSSVRRSTFQGMQSQIVMAQRFRTPQPTFDMGGGRIVRDIADPVRKQDAATKAYVDDHVSDTSLWKKKGSTVITPVNENVTVRYKKGLIIDDLEVQRNLRVQGDTIIAVDLSVGSDADIDGILTMGESMPINYTADNGAGSTSTIGLRAADTVNNSYVIKLPGTAPSNGQIMKWSGGSNGNLVWGTDSAILSLQDAYDTGNTIQLKDTNTPFSITANSSATSSNNAFTVLGTSNNFSITNEGDTTNTGTFTLENDLNLTNANPKIIIPDSNNQALTIIDDTDQDTLLNIDTTLESNLATFTFKGDINLEGTNTTGGVITATQFTTPSDRRLKKNIRPIKDPINILNKINGVTYNWKTQEDKDPKRIGLIAQEIEKVIPSAIVEKNNYKSVNYTELIGVLVEAVKELNYKIKNLEETLEQNMVAI